MDWREVQERMRQWRYLLALIVVMVATAGLVFYFPKRVLLEAQGVKYRLGDAQWEQSVQVRIDGSVHRNWLGRRTFEGVVSWEGEDIPVPEELRQLRLPLDKENSSLLFYFNNGNHYPVGMIAFDRKFARAAIALYEKREGVSGVWNGHDGLVLAVPATSQAEALEWSAELLGVGSLHVQEGKDDLSLRMGTAGLLQQINLSVEASSCLQTGHLMMSR